MADPIGMAASVFALVELVTRSIKVVKDIRDGAAERRSLLVGLGSTRNLLLSLVDLVDISNSEDPWFTTARQLEDPDGPLAHLKTFLERIERKLLPERTTSQRIIQSLTWSLDKEEVQSMLKGIERIKSLLAVALLEDNLCVPSLYLGLSNLLSYVF